MIGRLVAVALSASMLVACLDTYGGNDRAPTAVNRPPHAKKGDAGTVVATDETETTNDRAAAAKFEDTDISLVESDANGE
jgi:hypothetical protein